MLSWKLHSRAVWETIGIWVEAFALIAIFFLDWRERRDQRKERQAQHKETAEQLSISQEQVEAARKSADAAKEGAEATKQSIEILITKERARLRVEMKPLNLTKKPLPYTVDFVVSIHGPTAAYILETGCVTYTLPLDSVDCEDPGSAVIFPLYTLPSVLIPNNPPLEQFAFLFLTEKDSVLLLSEIKKGSLFVGVRGFIKYRDVFDRDRETRFRYVWKYLHGDFGAWEKCGKPEENQET